MSDNINRSNTNYEFNTSSLVFRSSYISKLLFLPLVLLAEVIEALCDAQL